MDLNELLYQHQMALLAVSRAQRDGLASPDFDLPCHYARRINQYGERRGLDLAVLRAAHSNGAIPTEFVGDTLSAKRGEMLP